MSKSSKNKKRKTYKKKVPSISDLWKNERARHNFIKVMNYDLPEEEMEAYFDSEELYDAIDMLYKNVSGKGRNFNEDELSAIDYTNAIIDAISADENGILHYSILESCPNCNRPLCH